jgi:CHAT domain-containing protein
LDRAPDLHLQPQELAELYEQARQHADSPPEATEVHPHLASCSVCRELFQELSVVERRLGDLRSTQPGPRQAACPEPSAWYEIVAGVTPPSEALVHVLHASRCDACGPLLREAVAIFNGEMTVSETEQIAALASARPEWQRRLAQQITGTSMLAPAPPSWWRKPWMTMTAPRLATAAALLLVLASLAWWGTAHLNRPPSADRLLASAYAEQRTMELRVSGAPYAPLRVQRGAEGSFASRPEALLSAEALIAGQLASHPSDAYWLQAKARVDLLEGKYEPAVDSLRRALQLQPKSSGILTDLASAYFQRGQAADRPEDYAVAYERLSQALAVAPDDPVALFNRAIVSERQFLYHQALDDWEHYLRIDPRSEWADEARKRADAVRERLRKHDESHAAPLLTPSQVVAQASSVSLRADMDQRVEEYLHDAVRSWLPQAYPERGAADPSAMQALFFLADLTSQQHGDRWLSDLLGGSSSPNFPQAVAALAAAVKSSDVGDYDRSGEQANVAVRLFQASGNTAGDLRAQFEHALSAQILRQSESCRRQATAAVKESEKHPYWWLQVQLGLEQSVCSGLTGDMGADQKAAQRAMERAQQAGYGALSLRALGFIANDRFERGDRNGAWNLTGTGFTRYWSGQFPAIRGCGLYGIAADMAESAGWPNLQLALWSEALALINSSEDLLVRAKDHAETARAATAARQPQLAEHHYAEAARLYALAPQSKAVRAYRLYNRIRAAQLESHLGQFDDASGRLTHIQDEVRRLSESYLVQMFYSSLGELQLSQHRYAEAEQALRPALALAEESLASLRSEEQRIRWSKDAASMYLGLAEAELAQGRAEESLDIFEWYLGAGQRAGTASGRSSRMSQPDLSQLSSRLPLLSSETVLAYGLLPDGLAIWTYDDHGVSAQWIPQKKDELQDLAGRFYDLTSDPKSDYDAVRRDARSLYTLLIAPIEQRLEPGRTIVIETDEWLSKLPFEALLDSSGHYLLERAPVVHSLGMYSDERLRHGAAISADSSALVVASTAASQADGLIPLPDVMAESETVASSFHSPRVRRGQQATLSMVKAGLQTAAVFHFAGHSLATSERTGLMLEDKDPQTGRPRLLDADSLRSFKSPNLQLAVLSACSTGKAGAADSSGFSSIVETLLRAGVPHVVASRWAVDSVQTRGFVEDFYHNLLSGIPVSEATRVTARKMLANPQTAHPYYWSAFAAYGRP